MKILEIYKNYKIPRNIQEHQLRVASVSVLIIENHQEKFDKDLIITACLLHDMGNIIKSDFDMFPEFLEPEGRAYWEEVKKSFIDIYGPNEDKATQQIAKELRVKNEVQKMLENFKYKDDPKNELEEYVNLCIYSDLRVGPHGIVSVKERFKDGEKRYLKRNIKGIDKEYFQKMYEIWPKRERKILKSSKIKPQDITEEKISKFYKNLTGYSLVAE